MMVLLVLLAVVIALVAVALHRRRGSGGGPDTCLDCFTDDQLLAALDQHGLRDSVARDLVADRRTAGGAWRIRQELSIQPSTQSMNRSNP